MHRCLFLCLVACGGGSSSLEVEEASCQAGQLTFKHTLTLDDGVASGQGSITTEGYAFGNTFHDGNGELHLGLLSISGGTPRTEIVRLEFEDALIGGDTVDARGFVKLTDQGLDAGNCETTGFSGRITDIGDGWKFTIEDLHTSPYCGGAAFSGAFAGCTRSSN
jgi:hypothetical protein